MVALSVARSARAGGPPAVCRRFTRRARLPAGGARHVEGSARPGTHRRPSEPVRRQRARPARVAPVAGGRPGAETRPRRPAADRPGTPHGPQAPAVARTGRAARRRARPRTARDVEGGWHLPRRFSPGTRRTAPRVHRGPRLDRRVTKERGRAHGHPLAQDRVQFRVRLLHRGDEEQPRQRAAGLSAQADHRERRTVHHARVEGGGKPHPRCGGTRPATRSAAFPGPP